MSMGKIVASGMPHIWITNELPYHVTDRSKLQVICPLKYRIYADRVDDHVPIFKENVRFSAGTRAAASPNFLTLPAMRRSETELLNKYE